MSLAVRATQDSWPATAFRYLVLGSTHIVPKGFDYLLFVVGIFLIGRRLRPVVAQVSAFTIAHSVTLASSVAVTGIGGSCCRPRC